MTLIHELDELIRHGILVGDSNGAALPEMEAQTPDQAVTQEPGPARQPQPVFPHAQVDSSNYRATREPSPPAIEREKAMSIGGQQPTQRSPKTRLLVRFQDGYVISEAKAADTFALTLQEIGLERVHALGKAVNGVPLISLKKHEAYTQRKIGEHYVMTHSNTKMKKDMLETVAKELGARISVEIVV